jgi:hypothetical protein
MGVRCSILKTICTVKCVEPLCGCFLSEDEVPWHKSGAALTKRWFTSRLRSTKTIPDDCEVATLTLAKFGVGEGMFSTMFRAVLTFEIGGHEVGNEGWPTVIIVKMTPPGVGARVLGGVMGAFRNEVCFYNDGASKMIPAPRCYYAAHGPHGRCV